MCGRFATCVIGLYAGKGDVTITMSDDDFFDLATGKLNAQKVCVFRICCVVHC